MTTPTAAETNARPAYAPNPAPRPPVLCYGSERQHPGGPGWVRKEGG